MFIGMSIINKIILDENFKQSKISKRLYPKIIKYNSGSYAKGFWHAMDN